MTVRTNNINERFLDNIQVSRLAPVISFDAPMRSAFP